MSKKEEFGSSRRSAYVELTGMLNSVSTLYVQGENVYRAKANHRLEPVCSICRLYSNPALTDDSTKGTQNDSMNKVLSLIVYAPSMLKILLSMASDCAIDLGKYEVPVQELLKEMNAEASLISAKQHDDLVEA